VLNVRGESVDSPLRHKRYRVNHKERLGTKRSDKNNCQLSTINYHQLTSLLADQFSPVGQGFQQQRGAEFKTVAK
jgi:hypothetical protein